MSAGNAARDQGAGADAPLDPPASGADAVGVGPLAGADALPLNGGTPGPVVIDPLTAPGIPLAFGISLRPDVVRGALAVLPAPAVTPSVPEVRSSVRSALRLHPAASITAQAITATPPRGKN